MKFAFFALVALLLTPASVAAVAPISQWQCHMMSKTGVLPKGAPVGCERLTKVDFEFVSFQGDVKQGSVIVLDVVAPAVEQIFIQLRERNFPLHSARLMREFNADDAASMSANNSSAFNARTMTGGSSWSKHAYGVAIDINPVQNPFLAIDDQGVIRVQPPQAAKQYVNRHPYRARSPIARRGMAEEVVELFAHHGFLIWGGDWNSPIDTQHFEVGSRAFINQLLSLPLSEASQRFQQYTDSYRTCFQRLKTQGEEKARAVCAYKTVKRY